MIKATGFIGLVLALLLAACMGPSHPRRAILIDVSKSDANYYAVANAIDAMLKENGFRNAASGGYDSLTNGAGILNYIASDGLFVSIGPYDTIEPSKARLIMVDFTQGGKNLSPASHQFVQRISERLEAQWPRSVSEWEPIRRSQ